MEGGGYDREWYAPLKKDGNRDLGLADETVGNHTGPFAGLNIVNPQPGYEYCWQRNDPRDILQSRLRGGEIVTGSDPEFAALQALQTGLEPTPLDTSQLYRELVLIRTPIEKVREQREKERQKAEVMAHGSIQDYVEGASPAEAEYGRRDGRGSTRLVRGEHAFEVEEDGKTSAVWTPRTGDIRR